MVSVNGDGKGEFAGCQFSLLFLHELCICVSTCVVLCCVVLCCVVLVGR